MQHPLCVPSVDQCLLCLGNSLTLDYPVLVPVMVPVPVIAPSGNDSSQKRGPVASTEPRSLPSPSDPLVACPSEEAAPGFCAGLVSWTEGLEGLLGPQREWRESSAPSGGQ